MSTRRTLWYSDEFHLYLDGFDNENVYLEIKSAHFQELVLTIPLAAWKEMRKHTIEPEERYLDLTEHELRAEAEREVDEHCAELAGKPDSRWKGLFGLLQFGPPEASREEMVNRFLTYYRPDLARNNPSVRD